MKQNKEFVKFPLPAAGGRMMDKNFNIDILLFSNEKIVDIANK